MESEQLLIEPLPTFSPLHQVGRSNDMPLDDLPALFVKGPPYLKQTHKPRPNFLSRTERLVEPRLTEPSHDCRPPNDTTFFAAWLELICRSWEICNER